MRILVVTPILPHPEAASAGALVMYGLVRALADHADHQVTVVTFAGPDPAERAALDRLRASGLDVRAVWRPPITGMARWRRRRRLASHWLGTRQPFRALEFREPAMQRLLDRLTERFDIIQVEDNAMAGYRYQPGAHRVLTEHEVRTAAPGWPGPAWANGFRGAWGEVESRRWRRYQPAIWGRFDRIQVFTPRDAAALRAMAPRLGDRVRINPFAIDLPPAVDPPREERGSLVFVGAFAHPPNVDAALWLGHDIMPLLRERWRGARLTIIGAQPPPAVRALASEDIIVTGHVPDVGPYLRRAAVVLAPLRRGGGMRLKVLQAMAYGKAVVTTPLGAEGLAVGAWSPPIAIAGDARHIADATAALLAEDDARHALGRRARAFVAEHHTWGLYKERLEGIYAELCPCLPHPVSRPGKD